MTWKRAFWISLVLLGFLGGFYLGVRIGLVRGALDCARDAYCFPFGWSKTDKQYQM